MGVLAVQAVPCIRLAAGRGWARLSAPFSSRAWLRRCALLCSDFPWGVRRRRRPPWPAAVAEAPSGEGAPSLATDVPERPRGDRTPPRRGAAALWALGGCAAAPPTREATRGPHPASPGPAVPLKPGRLSLVMCCLSATSSCLLARGEGGWQDGEVRHLPVCAQLARSAGAGRRPGGQVPGPERRRGRSRFVCLGQPCAETEMSSHWLRGRGSPRNTAIECKQQCKIGGSIQCECVVDTVESPREGTSPEVKEHDRALSLRDNDTRRRCRKPIHSKGGTRWKLTVAHCRADSYAADHSQIRLSTACTSRPPSIEVPPGPAEMTRTSTLL